MKRLKACLAAGLMLTVLAGCTAPEVDYSGMITPPLTGKVTDYITAAEVAAVVGEETELAGVYEEDTVAIFSTATGTVTVCLEQREKPYAEELMASLPDAVEQSGIGEKAFYCAQTGELMAYRNGFFVDVTVFSDGVEDTSGTAGLVAAAVLRHTPGGED